MLRALKYIIHTRTYQLKRFQYMFKGLPGAFTVTFCSSTSFHWIRLQDAPKVRTGDLRLRADGFRALQERDPQRKGDCEVLFEDRAETFNVRGEGGREGSRV